MLKIGSLFSGYLGLDMAVEEVFDARTAWVSDIDPGAVDLVAYPRGGGGIEALQHYGRGSTAGDGAGVPDQRDREPLRPGPDRGLTLLPTPAAANPNDGESVGTWEARRQRTKERVGNGNGFDGVVPPQAVAALRLNLRTWQTATTNRPKES